MTHRFAHSLTGKALLRLAVLGAAVLLLFGAVGAHLLGRDSVGARRSRSEIADGREHPTGWVRRGVPLDDDLRRRVVLFHDLT